MIVYPSSDAFILFEKANEVKSLKSRFGKTEYFAYKGFSLLEEKEIGFSIKSSIEENPTNMGPAYKLSQTDKFQMFPTKTVRVKMKPGKTQKDISSILSEYRLSGIGKKYGVIRIHLTDIRKVFALANAIYESNLAEFSLPDFYIEKKLNQVNDPLFPVQFQMNNTGQVVDGIAGVNNIDCNALEA